MALASSNVKSGTPVDNGAALVAFVSDDSTLADLNNFVRQLGHIDNHLAKGGVDAAIKYLDRVARPPQRLIVDISGLAKPLEELDKLALACDPSVLVYVLGEHNDVTLYRTLLQLGIRDYRYKPLALDAFRQWVEDIDGQPIRRTRTGRVIALAGTRGGVGVTTIATRLARQLTIGRGQRRVIYIDTDIYGGSSSTLMGMPPNHALSDLLHNSDRLDPQFVERTLASTDQRLFVLGSHLSHSEPFVIETGMMDALLEAMKQQFHYVVVDLKQAGGTLATEVFNRADIVCLMADHTVFSAQMMTRLILNAETRPRPPALHLLLNSVRPHTKGLVESAEFEEAVMRPISLDIPYDGKHPVLAENLGEPLPDTSELARAVQRLAAVITGEASLSSEPQPLLSRLFRRSS